MATYTTTLMQKTTAGTYDEVLVKGAYSTSGMLPSSGWDTSSKTVSIAVSGITADSLVFVSPAPDAFTAYSDAGIYCSEQYEGRLVFTCKAIPASNINVNIVIM